jgi:hypothetical protein
LVANHLAANKRPSGWRAEKGTLSTRLGGVCRILWQSERRFGCVQGSALIRLRSESSEDASLFITMENPCSTEGTAR